jgi:hypothetical protein
MTATHDHSEASAVPQFEAVTVRFAIDADASRDDLEALIAQSQKRSAVFDIVTNPTKVLVELT